MRADSDRFRHPGTRIRSGRIIGFEPVDLNGVPAANFPTVVDANPIVTTSCSPTPTSASHTDPRTISTTILVPTVTINPR